MSVRELFKRLVSGKKPQADSGSSNPARRDCPHESDVMAYLQNRMPERDRGRMEKHFADCDGCRELFAYFARVPNEQLSEADSVLTQPAEEEVKEQAAKVFAYIERDTVGARDLGERKKGGFYLSYPQLAAAALVFCAIAIGVVFWMTSGPSPEKSAMQMLAQALKDGRGTPARISGNLPHSDYTANRGAGEADHIQLERALATLKFAEKESAPADARQALARVHLAFNRPERARQALAILEQLTARGGQSPDLFNDIGVAWFQLGEYDKAIDSFTKALAISQNHNEALFNRALAEERAHRYSDAEYDWRRFISVASDDRWRAEAERSLNLLHSTPR